MSSTGRTRHPPPASPHSTFLEQNFGKSAPFSLGVEEEFQILNRESYELVSRIDEILLAFEGGEKEKRIKAELLQSVVEVATKVSKTVREALDDLRDLRSHLRDVAAEADALIASAGTHPFSRYEHQEVTERPRYVDLIESMRWVAERELIFGLHVHVGLDSPDKAIACANALRTYLPELLALSANSPFWQGRATGLASTRAKPLEPITLVAENKWRAARDGLNAKLIDFSTDSERPAPDAVRALVERARPAARELGCETELDKVEALVGRGSGSDEQLEIYQRTDSLLAVAKWLNEE